MSNVIQLIKKKKKKKILSRGSKIKVSGVKCLKNENILQPPFRNFFLEEPNIKIDIDCPNQFAFGMVFSSEASKHKTSHEKSIDEKSPNMRNLIPQQCKQSHIDNVFSSLFILFFVFLTA